MHNCSNMQIDDIKGIDYIDAHFNDGSYESSAVINRLRKRLNKLHYYEHVYFNGVDNEDAQRKIMCRNDPEDFVKIDLEGDLMCES